MKWNEDLPECRGLAIAAVAAWNSQGRRLSENTATSAHWIGKGTSSNGARTMGRPRARWFEQARIKRALDRSEARTIRDLQRARSLRETPEIEARSESPSDFLCEESYAEPAPEFEHGEVRVALGRRQRSKGAETVRRGAHFSSSTRASAEVRGRVESPCGSGAVSTSKPGRQPRDSAGSTSPPRASTPPLRSRSLTLTLKHGMRQWRKDLRDQGLEARTARESVRVCT